MPLLGDVYCIEHARHRSPVNFMVTLMGGLIAYLHFLHTDCPKSDKFKRLGHSQESWAF